MKFLKLLILKWRPFEFLEKMCFFESVLLCYKIYKRNDFTINWQNGWKSFFWKFSSASLEIVLYLNLTYIRRYVKSTTSLSWMNHATHIYFRRLWQPSAHSDAAFWPFNFVFPITVSRNPQALLVPSTNVERLRKSNRNILILKDKSLVVEFMPYL